MYSTICIANEDVHSWYIAIPGENGYSLVSHLTGNADPYQKGGCASPEMRMPVGM